MLHSTSWPPRERFTPIRITYGTWKHWPLFAAKIPRFWLATPFKIVDLADPESEANGIDWWLELTGRGGEGMVVKPYQFIASNRKGLVQPAVKCRGREYLRIIYGPEYTFPENLSRLRQRGLATKRSLALREFALGIEGLERFVRRSRFVEFMNAFSACWPWKANQSIRGCRIRWMFAAYFPMYLARSLSNATMPKTTASRCPTVP